MPVDGPLARKTQRPVRRGVRAPLKRKPKQLTETPTVFEPTAGAGGMVLQATRNSWSGRGRRDPAVPGTTSTTEAAADPELVASVPLDADRDAVTLARARQIAARLAVSRPPADVTARRGVGKLASVRYSGASDDIDLDATIARLVESPLAGEDEIVVREPRRTRRSVVLLVDVSGSMRGERVRTAAATVGALAGELVHDDVAVIAFWSDAAVLASLRSPIAPRALLETLLRIPAKGLTNVSFPLELARRELARVPAREARVLLLSDCVHNAGPDPRLAAAGVARLDVLLDATGEHDTELGRDLARLGRGRLAVVHTYRDVAPALSGVFR